MKKKRKQVDTVAIAWMYFHENMTQQQIADTLKISRSNVANYIQKVLDEKLIRFYLEPSIFESFGLSQKLKTHYQLQACYVVPRLSPHSTPMKQLTSFASNWLAEFITDNDTIALGWGETIYEVGCQLAQTPKENVTIVQAMGSAMSGMFSPEKCCLLFAIAFNAMFHNLPVPARLYANNLAKQIMQEPFVKRNFDLLKQCNKAIFSVGAMSEETRVYKVGIINQQELEYYRQNGACGDIAVRFLDKEGRQVKSPIDDLILGISVEILKNIEQVVLIAQGKKKVDIVQVMLRNEMVNYLIIDEELALALSEQDMD